MKAGLLALLAAAALVAAPPSYKDLKYPPLREVKIPEIPSYTLPNGIKLYLLENHELPLVGGFALVRTGSLYDPAGKTGLAELTGSVMRTGGTETKTGDQIDVELENVAASVESGIGLTSGRVSFGCLKENTDQVLAVFHDLLTKPAFRQDKFDLAKTQYRSAISRRNDDPNGILSREFLRTVYGPDTPYGRIMQYATLDNIQRGDVVAFYQRYFFPANTVIAVQGDFSVPEMRARIEKLFAGWTVQQQPVPALPAVAANPAPAIYLAARPDVTQSFFQMGHLSGVLKDKDYPALEVATDILGGGFSSRLFRKVRTAMGLAYNINASWGANFDFPGVFTIGGSTKSPSTVDSIQAARAELERIRTTEVTDEELRTAKETVLNSFVFNFDSPGKTLGRVVTYEYYGYPKDFIFQYQKAIEQVTKADVLRVAKQRFHPEQLTTVVVGKPEDFGKPLTTIGPVKNVDLTIPEGKPVAAAAEGPRLPGKPLLAKAQEAMGGREKLAAIRDLTEKAEVTIQAPQGAMKATNITEYILPSMVRQEQTLPFGKLTAFYDGKTGWLQGPQGPIPMADPVVKQIQVQLFRQIIVLLLSDNDPARAVNALDGRTLEITGNGMSVRVVLDPKSYLPLSETYTEGGQSVTDSYADWRDVNGVRLPFSETIEQGGRKFADVHVTSWSFNNGLKAEDLARKP